MFSTRADFTSLVCAILAHAGIAWAMVHMPARDPSKSRVIEMEVRKKELPPPPPPLTPPEPPPPPPPERKVTPKVKQAPPPEPPPQTPPPNQEPPKEPPKEPVEKIVGLNENSMVGESTFSMPKGNTTYGDPSKNRPGAEVKPLPAAPPPTTPKIAEYKPVSELFIKTVPEIDSDACGRSITYPDEALQLGVEGQVKLLVGLDEKGKVHRIKVLKGLGHGLDQVAIEAMRKSPACRFSAAVANDGKAAPYELEYLFTFEIPR